jgi:hypothetical protein
MEALPEEDSFERDDSEGMAQDEEPGYNQFS